jgi:Leucine-rich repeat (LRR) protein
VPEYVFGRTNLHTLDLSYNKLTGSLQAEVRKLSALRVLDMSHNAFTGVPAEVGQLAQLEMLDLSYNKLTGLPYELGNLKNLKTLDLRGNAYAPADLEMIKKGLPASTQVLID